MDGLFHLRFHSALCHSGLCLVMVIGIWTNQWHQYNSLLIVMLVLANTPNKLHLVWTRQTNQILEIGFNLWKYVKHCFSRAMKKISGCESVGVLELPNFLQNLKADAACDDVSGLHQMVCFCFTQLLQTSLQKWCITTIRIVEKVVSQICCNIHKQR